jgi:pimeloyl-ACP methyl ester carboxylesterase
MRTLPLLLVAGTAVLLAGCSGLRRSALFFPTHHERTNGLTPWRVGSRVIGYARVPSHPAAVWLLLHGNAGQASDRAYALPAFAAQDAVYILEYPGYGARPGVPAPDSFNAAADEAFTLLRAAYPGQPVSVAGESIGSGPACQLAAHAAPPDKIVLVVPFDDLGNVAAGHYPWLPVRWILGRTWDNRRALAAYRGPVEIFGAQDDAVIPVRHAQALAAAVPQAKFHLIAQGHNDWSRPGAVRIRFP